MPQSSQIPCDILVITHPRLDQLNEQGKEKIVTTIAALQSFVGRPPSRKVITGTVHFGNSIAGFFIEEGLREGLHGDNPLDLVLSEDSNYEKLFFALLLDRGLLVLQRTSLSDYVDLNYTTMRRDFFGLLSLLVNQAGVSTTGIQWERYYKKRTQEEMRLLFFGNTALEIQVSDLKGQKIREDIKLSNPDPEEESLLRRIYDTDFTQIDEEWLKAARDGDLRKTKTGRAAIGAGTVHKIVARPPDGEAETYYVEQDEKIVAPINTQKRLVERADLEAVIQIVERRYILPASILDRGHLPDLGPLFRFPEDKNE